MSSQDGRQAVGIVNRFTGGHHAEYDEFFASFLRRNGCPTYRSRRHLLNFAKNPLLFTTIDDATLSFCVTAAVRSFLGLQTVGVFLRPGSCFDVGLKYRIKRELFQKLTAAPNVTVLSIIPFTLDDRFSMVATDWIYDPQLWDLNLIDAAQDGQAKSPNIVQADQRKTIVVLGRLNTLKGFDLLVNLYCASETLRRKYKVIAAGCLDPKSRNAAQQLRDAGGTVIDTEIPRARMMELYRLADVVWACYNPSYDLSSGIFGRAVQFRVPVILREGSLLQKLSRQLDHPTLAIPYDDPSTALSQIIDWPVHQIGNMSYSKTPVGEVSSQVLLEALKIRRMGMAQVGQIVANSEV